MKSICRVRLLAIGMLASPSDTSGSWIISVPPDHTFEKERREVTTPSCTPPADALGQEFGIILKRGGELTPFIELNCDLPSVVD